MLILSAILFQSAAALIIVFALSSDAIQKPTTQWIKYMILVLMALASIVSAISGIGKGSKIDPPKPVVVDTVIVKQIDTAKVKQIEVMNNTISVFRDVFGAGSAGNDEFLKRVNNGL